MSDVPNRNEQGRDNNSDMSAASSPIRSESHNNSHMSAGLGVPGGLRIGPLSGWAPQRTERFGPTERSAGERVR
jgi:hypothetical protein